MVSIGGMVGTSGFYTDLSDTQWTIVAPLLPAAKVGGRPRTTCVRSVVDAIFYLLRTGCQWRLLPAAFRPEAPCTTTSVLGSDRVFGSAFTGQSTNLLERPPADQLAHR